MDWIEFGIFASAQKNEGFFQAFPAHSKGFPFSVTFPFIKLRKTAEFFYFGRPNALLVRVAFFWVFARDVQQFLNRLLPSVYRIFSIINHFCYSQQFLCTCSFRSTAFNSHLKKHSVIIFFLQPIKKIFVYIDGKAFLEIVHNNALCSILQGKKPFK